MIRYACLAMTASIIGFIQSPISANTIYVKQGAAGAGDGSSWTDAYPDLSAGLSATASGDQVWVAAGEYKPAAPGGPRSATFTLPIGVALLGGFPGLPGQEADASVRDAKAYVTVLSGDLNGDDNPPLGNRSDNAYHVVTIADSDANTKIDGFVVRCGQADGAGLDSFGGGIHVLNGSALKPLITGCLCIDNFAKYGGGAVRGSAKLDRCRFLRNRAQDGGAFSGGGSVTNCIFDSNSSLGYGGAADGSASYEACTFTRNVSKSGGGAVSSMSVGAINGCIFIENTSLAAVGRPSNTYGGGGGAIYSGGFGNAISNCTIRRNQAISHGGGVFGDLLLRNCLVAENRSAGNGGGVAGLSSGGTSVSNCSVVYNSAAAAGGVYAATGTVRHSVLWGNRAISGTQAHVLVPQTQIISSLLQDGVAGLNPPPSGPWPPGNLDADPIFSQDGSFQLLSGSPAIDAGTTPAWPTLLPTDIGGQPRVQDGNLDGVSIPDMGAYEFTPQQPALAVGETVLLMNAFEGGAAIQRRVGIQVINGFDVPYSASSNQTWVQITPANGVLTGSAQAIEIAVNPSNLTYGEYEAEITIDAPQAVNPQLRILVLLTVNRVFAVPSGYPTIQAAVNAAYLPGDVIELAPGVYSGAGNENVNSSGKSIVVRSASAQSPAEIRAAGAVSAFVVDHQERVRLENLQIMVSQAFKGLTAIKCVGSTLELRGCTITTQSTSVSAVLLSVEQSVLRVVDCDLRGSRGSGIAANSSDVALIGCRIAYCSAAVNLQYSAARVYDSLVYANDAGVYGRGFSDTVSGVEIVNSTIVNNSGRGVDVYTNLLIENTIVWGNSTSPAGPQVYLSIPPYSYRLGRIHHSIIQEGAAGITPVNVLDLILGPQIIDAPPIFRDVDGVSNQPVDLLTRDYRLTPCSPGVDAGDNGALPRDEFDLDGDGDTREPMPLDLAGQARRVDIIEVPDTGAGVAPIVDIGAYETVPSEQVEFCRAVSRKDHAAAGTLDVDLNLNATSRATVEPRLGGATRLVLTFTHPLLPIDGVFDANNLQVLGGAQVGGMTLDGATATIDLVAVPDKSCVCMTLLDMKDEAGAALPPLWTCVRNAYGDASNDGSVNLGDALTAKGFVGKPLTASTARYDVNLTGQINVGDLLAIKAKASSTPAAQCP